MYFIEIFKLFGSVFIDNDKANESISKTEKKAEGMATKLGKGIKTVGKIGMAVGGAAIAGGAALFGMASQAAGVTDNIDKLSQKLGMSRQGFQEWEFIASQSGTSVEKLSAGMKGLATKMMDAENGGKSTTAMFKKLGIEIKDTNGVMKSQEQVFEEAITVLQGMEDGTEKAALATELFGKSGQELMPLLNGATGSVEEMKNMAHELGLVMSDEAIDAGVAFTDQMDQLKRSFSAVTTQIGVKVMPIVSEFADWVLSNMPTIQSVIGGCFEVISFFVGVVVDIFRDYLLPILNELWEWVEPYIPQIQQLFTDAFNGMSESSSLFIDKFKEAWDTLLKPILDLLGETIQFIWETFMFVWPSIEELINNVFNSIVEIWDNIFKPVLDFIMEKVGEVWGVFEKHMPQIQQIVKDVFDMINRFWLEVLQPVFKAIEDYITNVLLPVWDAIFTYGILPVIDSLFTSIGELWENSLKPIFNGIIDFIGGVFSGDWGKAWDGVISIFEGIWEGLKTVAKAPLNALIGMINSVIGGLNKISIDIPWWVPGFGGNKFGINIPQIPRFAKGTDYFNPSKTWGNMALVGEEGPELINLKKGDSVTPAKETAQALGGGFTLQIKNFYNNTDQDLEDLADELAFLIQKKQKAYGG